ncbi:outer membrane protein assembly factor [Marinibactrum halimedae]|uniref:Outer membrane protein assembly factor n=1 Tax=Marinibactrum halimedae TaxID=1444977 RepID=A0AA37T305_9GAMM|nr:outer membrane protein assembly factor [Marinibactrum halimedae]
MAIAEESCRLTTRLEHSLEDSFDRRIRNATKALGYYHAKWEAAFVHNDDENGKKKKKRKYCWTLELDFEPGEPTTYSAVEISITGEGKDDNALHKIASQPPMTIGEVVHHGQYESFKSQLQNRALQRGYADAEFTEQQLSINIDTHEATATLVFNVGQRYRFGPISFEQTQANGKPILDEDYLQRFLTFQPGEEFDIKPLGQFQQSLIDSRYFGEVDVQQLPPDKDRGEIPIQVVLTPGKRYTTSLGVGYQNQPDPSPRTSVKFDNRRVNRRGHRFSTMAEAALNSATVDMDYRIPLENPNVDELKFFAGWEQEESDTNENETWSTGAALTKRLPSEWLRTYDLTYLVETSSVEGEDELSTTLLLPGIAYTKSYANDYLYPTWGWRLSARARAGAEGAGSDITLSQVRAGGKQIIGFLGGRFIGRVDLGTTIVDDIERVPASLRFFAGGDNSVRGYDYESLGPKDEEGNVVGGKHMITASLEYDHLITDTFGFAVFTDAGNAFDNDEFEWKQGAGVGLRWLSPVGPVRFDIGVPVNDDDADAFQIHLSLGADL